jgi:hypothetical protein
LIDAAGCRGLIRGGAMVSQRHANFLINVNRATAADLESLGEEVRQRVYDNSGVMLEWEIERIGRPISGVGGQALPFREAEKRAAQYRLMGSGPPSSRGDGADCPQLERGQWTRQWRW